LSSISAKNDFAKALKKPGTGQLETSNFKL
jgi:hypothetical protein